MRKAESAKTDARAIKPRLDKCTLVTSTWIGRYLSPVMDSDYQVDLGRLPVTHMFRSWARNIRRSGLPPVTAPQGLAFDPQPGHFLFDLASPQFGRLCEIPQNNAGVGEDFS